MRANSRTIKRVVAVGTIAVASLGLAGMASAHSTLRPHKAHRWHHGHMSQALYVSNSDASAVTAADRGSRVKRSTYQRPHWSGGRGCSSATYTTIGAAVSCREHGGHDHRLPGKLPRGRGDSGRKPLTLEGVGNPIINAMNLDNGVQILASDSTVEGFTIGYATGEGILVGSQPAPGRHRLRRDDPRQHRDRQRPRQPHGGSISTRATHSATCRRRGRATAARGSIFSRPTTRPIVGNDITANSGGILITTRTARPMAT